ncbi:pyridoxal phosphate-dependent aminotransferase [Ekhidna sp.]
MIEGHGDDMHRYDEKIIHNFSSNIYYKGCPPKLLSELTSQSKTIQNYPSPAAEELSKAAANKFGLSSDHFLFTNGATEAFYLIAHIFSGKKAAIASPTFSEYEDACKIHGIAYQLIDKEGLNISNYDLVFICNPNNPDGRAIQSKRLVKLIQDNPSSMFVIDEAYIEFTNQTESLIPFIDKLPNLIIVRSLTKSFAIPGLRLGYVITSPNIIESLISKKMPWSVNALAVQAGLLLFKKYESFLFDIEELLDDTRAFIKDLSEISWLEINPTDTSYFLVKLDQGTASDLKDFLVRQHRILIRDATNFKLLDGEYIRLSTQNEEANATLIKALKQWN